MLLPAAKRPEKFLTRASFQQMFLNTATVVVTLLAGVVGYAHLHEILSPRVGDGARTSIVTDWRKYAAAGVRLGPDGARVTIIEFSDFQCPFCRVASGDLDDLQQWYGHDLAVVYRNFPIHPFAHSAAVAAECAAGMGAFEALDHRFFCRAGLDRYEVLGELRA